jgi:parallel beta-helix repeat protein
MNVMAFIYQQILRQTSKWILALLMFAMQTPLISQEVVPVGGTLEENTVWSNEFTYMVRENLRVPEGVELTIMPGVLVEFYANTGLFVEQGTLKILGNYNGQSAPVVLRPRGNQEWLGISFFSVIAENENIIDNAIIERADIGIDLRSSKYVVVQNSTIQGGAINDIRLHNSSFCVISNNSFIQNSRHAIEIYATGLGNQSSSNIVSGNYIDHNRLIGIMVRFDNQGICYNNLIQDNIIEGAETGIYIDNTSFFNINDKIKIKGNVFANIGSSEIVSYCISSGMDSTFIQHNIFWNSERAIELRRGNRFFIENNSFYQNYDAISIEPLARNVSIRQNTLVGNRNYLVVFREAAGNHMLHNNIFGNKVDEGIIRNLSPNDINVTENYWATDDTTKVKQLLFDGNDDEAFGSLSFQPILLIADTAAPVSPPQGFVKQLINGDVLLSWHANPESDLSGYALYSGTFEKYSFDAEPIIVSDTSILLQSVSIDINFALTAFDAGGNGWQQQRLGQESPYVFAIAAPFAGHDTLICVNDLSFTVSQSTVPFPYEQLYWHTEGDGHFDDLLALRPSYEFGSQDIENGKVRLWLHVLHMNGTSYTDSFLLTLRNDPVVEGPGTIVVPPETHLTLDDVFASDYDQIEWFTSGDGYFDDPNTESPNYFFGQLDLTEGHVQLIVQVISACGFDSDTINIFLKEQYSLEGKVFMHGIPAGGVVVLAATELIDQLMRTVDMVTSNDDGSFVFKQLFAANYLFYAIPDTLSTSLTLPVYYPNKLRWQAAFRLPLTANTYHVEIELKELSVILPPGEGSLSGKFHLPDPLNGFELYCQPWFTPAQREYCSDGLSNMTILLHNDKHNVPLAYTVTDNSGYFHFRNLPFGDYYLEAEKAGFETNLSALISLSPSAPDRNGIALFIEEESKIKIYVPERNNNEKGLAYPNPASNQLNIAINSDWVGITSIDIFNAYGQHLKHETRNLSKADSSGIITISTTELPQGLFFIRLASPDMVMTYSFIISR